jgi:hypothetical protein
MGTNGDSSLLSHVMTQSLKERKGRKEEKLMFSLCDL